MITKQEILEEINSLVNLVKEAESKELSAKKYRNKISFLRSCILVLEVLSPHYDIERDLSIITRTLNVIESKDNFVLWKKLSQEASGITSDKEPKALYDNEMGTKKLRAQAKMMRFLLNK